MKKKNAFAFLLGAMMFLTVSLTACSNGILPEGTSSTNRSSAAESTSQGQSVSSATSKILVAYFSQTGHTRTVAEQIHDQAGGNLFEIVLEKPYSSDYSALTSQAQKEHDTNYKPQLKTKVDHMALYDVIFVGSPVWYGTLAPPVQSFLSEYDFSGKTIIPFDTNMRSGLGSIVTDIKKLCPKATVLENGLAVRDSDADHVRNMVAEWLKKINIAE